MTNQPIPTKEFVQQAVAQILCANTLSLIVQMLSAQLLGLIKMSIFSGCIEKSRILWYNYLTVGIGPAKATVWKGFHAVFVILILYTVEVLYELLLRNAQEKY